MPSNRPDKLRFLPVGLDVRRKNCLIVGGGNVGTRKAHSLVRAEANVIVLSPTVTGELAKLIEAGHVRWIEDSFREELLEGAFLVIAVTDDEAQNAEISRLAGHRGALVCDASSAERSGVIFGALLHDDGVTVAVFTDGRDPAKARRTRDRIANFIGKEDGLTTEGRSEACRRKDGKGGSRERRKTE
ncbi:MAG: bifunctional precorrin-2 dehydrogenase/sirohydrochlorin ferrochelatase [Candidatus Nealsonbacteria bacterium]|nr:bifunctional precorrin-2 dehydrogenase/sirohydrochlorin ferrochelatase [Candidatus Nealsonbacteria bacterium]